MAKYPVLKGLLTVCLLGFGGSAAFGQPANAPPVSTMLKFSPAQTDVAFATPTADEIAGCKVEAIRTGGVIVGWHLLDVKKEQSLRKFFDSRGGKDIDTWSYYKDGAEVYREIDTNGDGKPDQYRWLNTGGMKWGVDVDGDGKIDAWRMISAEELGHEMFQALATNNFARLKALLMTPADLQALKVAGPQAVRIQKLVAQAKNQFDKVLKEHASLTDKATYLRIESGAPQCVPADGSDPDLIRYPSRSILYESPDKKHDWLQTGEIIKVGAAWRVVEVTMDNTERPTQDPRLQKLLTDLDALDKTAPPPNGAPVKDEKVQSYNRQRVALVKQIIQVIDQKEKETWWKQMFDNLSAGAQGGDDTALKELSGYRAQLEKSSPGSNLTAYAAYRELWATYAPQLAGGINLQKIQEEWHEKLSKFVQDYSKSEDAPDAIHQLALGSEFNGKDETSKRWYRQLYTAFPEHPFAEKAKGAEKRLDLVGRALELSATTLSGQPYNITDAKGKVVVVYYYASFVPVCVGDFARLKQIVGKHAESVELVCVNLDDTAQAAKAFVQANSPIGIHLFEAKQGAVGQNGRLSVQYGINGLPTMFLIGRDGRVLNRTLQIGDLDEALRKAL